MGGNKAGLPAAILHMHSQWLDVTANNIGAVTAGRAQHSQGDGIYADNADRAVLMGEVGNGLALVLKKAQIRRVFKIYCRGGRRQALFQSFNIHPAGLRACVHRINLHRRPAIIPNDSQSPGGNR